MKAYTDIEQSKKLAEILPIESADMYYKTVLPKSPNLHKIPEIGNPIEDLEWYNRGYTFSGKEPLTLEEFCIPCWSLATLLDFLPPYLFEFERGIDLIVYRHLNGKKWHCSYMPNCIENMKTDKFRLMTCEDTLIDCCVQMILQLNELKML